MECWYFNKKCLEIQPEGYYGFTYKITCIHPDYKGWIYIGKKQFLHRKTTKLSKKARVGTRKRINRGTKDSGWLTYYGSSTWVKELVAKYGTKYFKREVLAFATSKTDLALQEWEYICEYKVLRIKEAFNLWASGRIYKKYL